jgi:hypothetical protein
MKRVVVTYGSKPQISSAEFHAALKRHGFRVAHAKIEDAFRTRHGERLNTPARAAEHCRFDWFFAARAGHSADDSSYVLLGKNGAPGQLTLR